MRIEVDLGLCQGHGQCEFAAPGVFTVGDDGKVAYEERPPETERANVENAARRCPVRAITLHED